MADINLLDSNTIDKIAAGEVVENPASIVKELVENSMDGNATSITVEIKNGGIEYIRVTDNGSGISKDNIKKAFLRHATSKINSIDDLFVIKSMGFRGEALASISSVSKVELISKTKDDLMGNQYIIEGSKEIAFEEIGAPNGTSIIVRNLFYNTPARRKFLKSENTEANYISDVIQHLSMCRPDISFNYIVNGKPRLSTSGNNDLKEVIYRLYGRDIIKEIIPIDIEENGIRVKGYLGEPSQNRATRNYETYFINNRLIKSKEIYSGIEDGYKEYTMQHKFPFCVLHFFVDTTSVDINVHPQKKEVRFLNKDILTTFISQAVCNTLHDNEMITSIKLDNTKNDKPEVIANPEPFEINRTKEFKITSDYKEVDESKADDFGKGFSVDLFNDNEYIDSEDTSLNEEISEDFIKEEINSIELNKDFELYDKIVVDVPSQTTLFQDERFISTNSRKEYSIIGQIFNTYWIIELKDKIYFVDQHAAHEKVNYERIMKRVESEEPQSQLLNPPIIITLTPKDKISLEKNIEYFNKIGFEIEDMGINEIGLRAVPLELYFNNPKEMFIDIIGELSSISISDSPSAITKKVATMACKASVKGGMKITRQEMEVLLDELLTLDNPYHCPHGRPTIFSMTQYELEKKFMRIVN